MKQSSFITQFNKKRFWFNFKLFFPIFFGMFGLAVFMKILASEPGIESVTLKSLTYALLLLTVFCGLLSVFLGLHNEYTFYQKNKED